MKKNVAGQVIGCQMVNASDGLAFTGAVTCFVTTDNGTQAAGATGAGACTHKGNGYHTYVPSQAETNHDQMAFTFVGSGAVPRTQELNPVDEVFALQTSTLTTSGSIGQRLAPLGFITATAGSTTQITLPGVASSVNQFYHDAMFSCVEGTGNGQTATCDTYNGSTKVAVFYEPVATAFDSTSKFFVLHAATTGDVPTASEFWAELVSAMTVVGSMGKHIVDSFIGVRAKTDPLTYTVSGKPDINIKAINDDLTAAVQLGRAASAIYVGTITGSPSQTGWVDSALPGAADGHWNGSVAILLSTALKGSKSTVQASVASTHAITLKVDEPLPAAPSIGDAYLLV